MQSPLPGRLEWEPNSGPRAEIYAEARQAATSRYLSSTYGPNYGPNYSLGERHWDGVQTAPASRTDGLDNKARKLPRSQPPSATKSERGQSTLPPNDGLKSGSSKKKQNAGGQNQRSVEKPKMGDFGTRAGNNQPNRLSSGFQIGSTKSGSQQNLVSRPQAPPPGTRYEQVTI